MGANRLAVDYLVVGAGAVGMAFVDTLLDRSDATVAIVDRRDHPGGHWNDAYPFVRLHAPALFYRAASMPLDEGGLDRDGLNAGNRSLATKPQLLDYYDRLLHHRFLPSGRVTWLPRHEYAGGKGHDCHLLPIVAGGELRVEVRRRLVDATWTDIDVPATHLPGYGREPGVVLIPPGGLERLGRSPKRFCVVGAGKTATDTCLWLLTHGVDPSRLRWIKPRESWINDRAVMNDFETFADMLVGRVRAVAEATSLADYLRRITSLGLMRIDEVVEPTQFKGALLSRREVALLRTVTDVVRLGHVRWIEAARIVLDRGSVPAIPDTVYVDCTAAGLKSYPPVPVFAEGRITPQNVRDMGPLFSASFIAFVASLPIKEEERNALCGPIPPPSTPGDMLRGLAREIANGGEWAKRPGVMDWVGDSPLGILNALDGQRARDPGDPLMRALFEAIGAAAPHLPALIADADRVEGRRE